MTLLQTRVDDRTARMFNQVAKSEKMSVYELLAALVKSKATDATPDGWLSHREKLQARGQSPLPVNAAVVSREEESR